VYLCIQVETTVREENLNSYRPELLLVLLDFVYPDSRCEVKAAFEVGILDLYSLQKSRRYSRLRVALFLVEAPL